MLPVREVQSQIIRAVREDGRLVLRAPTGSGKTTQVPQMLLAEGDIDGRIIVLQPRRLATRLVARRVADELNTKLGDVVGYQTRHERVMSRATRIVFSTEGLFVRQLQRRPDLPGVGAVVLDEFHERNLDADVSLALLKRLRERRRPELRLVVMSATLDVDRIARYLQTDAGDTCPVVEAEGRTYPVEVRHVSGYSDRPVWEQAAAALPTVLREQTEGDVLIFMPGVREIHRTIRAIEQSGANGLALHALHGSLPPAEQDKALAPDAAGRRKIIVTTNVAETSLTIENVRAVIDSGLAREHRFDPQRELNVLRVEPISRASAEQRAGRAGRTSPGLCLRLWPASSHGHRPAHQTCEIQRLDLAPTLLQLKAMGLSGFEALDWLDQPPPNAVERARRLLDELGAVDEVHALTADGRAMAAVPTHPRLGRMLLEAARLCCLGRAITWAALIAERDIFRPDVDHHALRRHLREGEGESDLLLRERAMAEARAVRFSPRACGEMGMNAAACREVDQAAAQLRRWAISREMPLDPGATADLLVAMLRAYGDHVAMKPDADRPHVLMVNRRGVAVGQQSVVRQAGPLVAAAIEQIGRAGSGKAVTALASAVSVDLLEAVHGERVHRVTQPRWNTETQAAEEVEQLRYDGLVLQETARACEDRTAAADMLVERIQSGQLTLARWDEAVRQWIERSRCLRDWLGDERFLAYDDDELAVILHEIVNGATRYSEVRDRPVLEAVRHAMDWADQQRVEKLAPVRLTLPSGYRMPITYEHGSPPRGRAKIQQLYGCTQTPRVAGGRVAVTLEILGPNFRAVQITSDLESFWQRTYPELKRELQRRYPKHEWR